MFGQCGPGKPCSTPFGGPASGLWPSGRSQESAGPSVQGAQLLSCLLSDIFSDCFTGCLTPATCGWTVLTAPPTVSFDGDQMVMGRVEPDIGGDAFKALSMPMPAAGFTVQFKFNEQAMAIPGFDQSYEVNFSDGTGLITCKVRLLGGGVLTVNLGGPQFTGAWTPLGSSAPHVVHFTYDGVTPLLFIDGIPIALGPIAPAPLSQAPSSVLASITKVAAPIPPGDGIGAFDWIFAASGVLPPSTVFCCPGGTPPT